jgi:hypothetical protein
MIRAQLSSPQRPPAPERQRPQSNGGIRVATSGLNLPPEGRRAFQSEVQQLVQERLGGMSQAQSRPQVTVCGCPPFSGCCWPPAGTLWDLTQIAHLLPPQPNNPPIKSDSFSAGRAPSMQMPSYFGYGRPRSYVRPLFWRACESTRPKTLTSGRRRLQAGPPASAPSKPIMSKAPPPITAGWRLSRTKLTP